uniref:Late embryogenesis abundant protein LEA-2 subgroup domain-containing protein n=1 Tax=Oryza punctata TaxID=4537 RepID=A0A0E0JY75_ORYPU
MDTDDAAKPPSPRLRVALLACGIASAVVAATLLAVTLTVFRVREPVMTMNAISVKGFGGAAPGGGGSSSPPPLWLTVVADVSVKNPNAASLRYTGSETAVYYRAARVGGASGPPGTARARRTVRLNVTVDVAVGALLGDPGFLGDVAAGSVAVTTATTVRGRVAVLGGAVRRRVVLEMNCTATIAVADMSIRNQSCLQRVWL